MQPADRGQGKQGKDKKPAGEKKMKLVNGKWVEVEDEEDSGDQGQDDQGPQ